MSAGIKSTALAHQLDQPRDMLGRCLRDDAVAEIEDEGRAGHASPVFSRTPVLHLRPTGDQQQRIEIALHDLAGLLGESRHLAERHRRIAAQPSTPVSRP